jgi:hypothetical protein
MIHISELMLPLRYIENPSIKNSEQFGHPLATISLIGVISVSAVHAFSQWGFNPPMRGWGVRVYNDFTWKQPSTPSQW